VSPRRKNIADATVAQHACRLLVEGGPAAVTFAQVSESSGLAPPTLVQRFGTREGMLLAAAAALRGRVSLAVGDARQSSVLTGLRAALSLLAPDMVAAVQLAREVPLHHYALELRKQISFALAEAVEAAELPHCDVAQLARTIQISAMGAVAIALLERGDAVREVGLAFDAQLASYT
jgi:AcrR family transcriptional regulator